MTQRTNDDPRPRHGAILRRARSDRRIQRAIPQHLCASAFASPDAGRMRHDVAIDRFLALARRA